MHITHANCIYLDIDDDAVYLTYRGVVEEYLRTNQNFSLAISGDFLDIVKGAGESFGIADAHIFQKWSSTLPSEHQIKVCFISAGFITVDAQNQLLKIFEEPNKFTYVFCFISKHYPLLQTFLSRLNILEVRLPNIEGSESVTKAKGTRTKSIVEKDFFSLDYKERLKIARNMAKIKDAARTRRFLEGLEAGAGRESLARLRAITDALTYYSVRGSTARVYLEYLALL